MRQEKTGIHLLNPIRIMLCLLLTSGSVLAQSVSISPSRLYFTAEPGQTRVQKVRVTNSSETKQSFMLTFADFDSPGNQGKTEILKPGESPNSCAQWLSASPSLLELEGGETKEVDVILQLPNTPDANRVTWASMFVKLARERTDPADLTNTSTGFGIMQTFQFVVHIFQTPPKITFKDAQILSFEAKQLAGSDEINMVLHVKNTGETIIDVAAYLDYTNNSTGETYRDKARAFTILPQGSREVKFKIPQELKSGKHTVLAVVDFGSRESVIASETELSIP